MPLPTCVVGVQASQHLAYHVLCAIQLGVSSLSGRRLLALASQHGCGAGDGTVRRGGVRARG